MRAFVSVREALSVRARRPIFGISYPVANMQVGGTS